MGNYSICVEFLYMDNRRANKAAGKNPGPTGVRAGCGRRLRWEFGIIQPFFGHNLAIHDRWTPPSPLQRADIVWKVVTKCCRGHAPGKAAATQHCTGLWRSATRGGARCIGACTRKTAISGWMALMHYMKACYNSYAAPYMTIAQKTAACTASDKAGGIDGDSHYF